MTYYLVNTEKDTSRKLRILDLAAKLAIYHSPSLRDQNHISLEHLIQEVWGHTDDAPPVTRVFTTPTSEIKWYIYNYLSLQDGVWNGDYIHGLAVHGKIDWTTKYPNLCSVSKDIEIAVNECPWACKSNINLEKRYYTWHWIPALCLKYSEQSTSFLAGFFSGGKPYQKDGLWYASYKNNVMKHIEKWGIPIEHKEKSFFLISLIWPSLFKYKMPPKVAKKWEINKKAAMANEYAAILWTIYVDTWYIKDAIPYLKSRRWVFYHYKSKEGTKKRLELLRIERDLTMLNYRIRESVHDLAKRYNGTKEERKK